MRLATLIPFLFAVLSFAVAVYFFLQGNGQNPNLVPAYGTVISKSVVEGQGHSIIQFITESGQPVTFQSQSELSPYYEKDETVYVHYSPSHPEKAQDVVDAVSKDKNVPIILALVACALGLIVFIKMGHAPDALSTSIGRILLAGLGLVFLGTGALGIYKTQQNSAALLHAQGQVVDVLAAQSNAEQPGNYDHQQVLYYPIIKFTTEMKQRFTVKSDIGYPLSPYKAGDMVTITYDANQPHQATLQGSPVSLVIKLVLLILGAVCLVLSIRFLK